MLWLTVHTAAALTVEGVGYTKETAIANALRNAVERSVGVYVGGETLVKNHMLVSDKILTRTDGYVRSYNVTSTAKELGLVRVSIDAEVAEGKLRDDLVAQQLLYEIKNRPRIMVLLDERVEGKEMFEKTATHVLEGELLERGFKIVEPEQFQKVKEIERAKALANEDLASLGFRTGADLIIRGRISVAGSTPKMVYGVQFYTVPVQLNARIVRADNARILVTRTARTKKNSREEFSAAQFGLETGARTLAEELIGALNDFWKSEAYNRNEVELTITGVEGERRRQAEAIVRSLPFVRDMALRYLEGKSALYDLRITGTVQDLRFALEGNKELGLSVLSVTANRLTIGGKSGRHRVSFTAQQPGIEVTTFKIRDIFPSRARYYGNNPLGLVKVRSNNRPARNLRISVHIPQIMQLPVEAQLDRIGPGAEERVNLDLLPEQDKLLANNETRTVNGQVKVAFAGPTGAVTRSLTAPATVHHKNAMDWMEPDAVGGFVTYNAAPIRALARKAVHAAPAGSTLDGDLLNAAALFESLDLLGIKYVKDPTPSGSMVLDMVQYPTETLQLRSGDCDDLSVLYAALLSAIGIRTAIISYHDHVLVMFDTGIFRKNRGTLSADTTLSVVHQGTVWIPIETTLTGQGFVKAWHVAAEEFHRAVREKQRVSIIDLRKAWKDYPPVGFEKGSSDFALQGLTEAVSRQQNLMEKAAAESIDHMAVELRKVSPRDRTHAAAIKNSLGLLAARKGDYGAALEHFKKARRKNDAPGIVSNQACALLLTGEEREARKLLDKVYRDDRTGGIAVNRALVYYVGAHDEAAVERFVEALQEAVAIMPSSASLSEYLGMDMGERAGVRAADGHEEQKSQTVNIRRLKELVRQRVLSRKAAGAGTKTGDAGGTVSGTTNETSTGQSADKHPPAVMPFGGIRGADPEQVEKVRDLLYWFDLGEGAQ